MLVSFLIVGIDAGRLSRGLDDRLPGMICIEDDAGLELLETTLHARKEVTDAESDVGMRCVGLPFRRVGLGCSARE